jgi:hypothetical protein
MFQKRMALKQVGKRFADKVLLAFAKATQIANGQIWRSHSEEKLVDKKREENGCGA